MKIILSFLTLLFIEINGLAQVPPISWAKCFGGTGSDHLTNIQQTIDGGYICSGISDSVSGDVTANHGFLDYWILKLDANGKIQWQKSYGGSGSETPYSIKQTKDKGYIIVGVSNSKDGDITNHHGTDTFDCWIVKIDATGAIQWQKSYGGSNDDGGTSIEELPDGSYIVSGNSFSNDGDVTEHHGPTTGPGLYSDAWVIKIDGIGNIQWQKSYGGTKGDIAYSIHQVTSGEYIVAGNSSSTDWDVTNNHGQGDYWVFKLNSTGTLLWQKTYGGTSLENLGGSSSFQQLSDGNYILVGSSSSNDGDVTNNHGGWDYWVIKINNTGAIQWQKSFGGSAIDIAKAIHPTFDKGFIISGTSASTDGDVSGGHLFGTDNLGDFWVVKTDSIGDFQWQKCLGGSFGDEGMDVIQTKDTSYVVAGIASSLDGDVIDNHGPLGGNGIWAYSDYWIVKLGGSASEISSYENERNIFLYPNPSSDQIRIQVNEEYIGSAFILYDVIGKEVVSGKINSLITVLKISELINGMYFLQIGKNDKAMFKISKN